jgi:hypothetical protein
MCPAGAGGDPASGGEQGDFNEHEGSTMDIGEWEGPHVLAGKGFKLLTQLGPKAAGVSASQGRIDSDSDHDEEGGDAEADDADSVVSCIWAPDGKLAVAVYGGGDVQHWTFHKGVVDHGKRCAVPPDQVSMQHVRASVKLLK